MRQSIILLEKLRSQPAIHLFCSDVFLQEPLLLDDGTVLTPLFSLGKNDEVEYLNKFITLLSGQISTSKFAFQGERHRPVVILSVFRKIQCDPEILELELTPLLSRLQNALAWASGNYPTVFGIVVASSGQISAKLLQNGNPTRRIRLGFGNIGNDFTRQFSLIMKASETDEHFAFALSMYFDAVREINLHFKAARFFACLEALAYRLKNNNIGSREAVKRLFQPDISFKMSIDIDGKKIQLDVIEICGKIRDKLFHGAIFDEQCLKADTRPYFVTIQQNIQNLVDQIQSFCEIHLTRWANGKSAGQM